MSRGRITLTRRRRVTAGNSGHGGRQRAFWVCVNSLLVIFFIRREGKTMGTPGHRFSTRYWLTLVAIAAAASAAVVAMASLSVGATTSKILLTAGDPITAGEGNLVEDQVVAHFTDADNIIPSISAVQRLPKSVACSDSDTYTASINWGDGSAATAGSVSCSGP